MRIDKNQTGYSKNKRNKLHDYTINQVSCNLFVISRVYSLKANLGSESRNDLIW